MCIRDRITPKHTSCTPPTKQTMQIVEAQPATTLPMAASTMAQITPMKLMRLTTMPAPVSYTHLDVYKRQAYVTGRVPAAAS